MHSGTPAPPTGLLRPLASPWLDPTTHRTTPWQLPPPRAARDFLSSHVQKRGEGTRGGGGQGLHGSHAQPRNRSSHRMWGRGAMTDHRPASARSCFQAGAWEKPAGSLPVAGGRAQRGRGAWWGLRENKGPPERAPSRLWRIAGSRLPAKSAGDSVGAASRATGGGGGGGRGLQQPVSRLLGEAPRGTGASPRGPRGGLREASHPAPVPFQVPPAEPFPGRQSSDSFSGRIASILGGSASPGRLARPLDDHPRAGGRSAARQPPVSCAACRCDCSRLAGASPAPSAHRGHPASASWRRAKRSVTTGRPVDSARVAGARLSAHALGAERGLRTRQPCSGGARLAVSAKSLVSPGRAAFGLGLSAFGLSFAPRNVPSVLQHACL